MILLGNAPTSWGIEKPADPTYVHWTKVLDEARSAGYRGIELGPYGFLPTDPAALRDALRSRSLQLTAGVIMDLFHVGQRRAPIVAQATNIARLLASQSATHLVIISGLADERIGTAGRSGAARRLDADQRRIAYAAIADVTEIARDNGLRAVIHTHAGTHIEFRDELDHILEVFDPDRLGLCIDTGHARYAGMDPVELLANYRHRLSYVHAKDLSASVHRRALDERLGFWQAYRLGVFCPLGAGCIDLAGFVAALDEIRYRGWITVEQDTDPSQVDSVLANATTSAAHLTAAINAIGADDRDPTA